MAVVRLIGECHTLWGNAVICDWILGERELLARHQTTEAKETPLSLPDQGVWRQIQQTAVICGDTKTNHCKTAATIKKSAVL